ncbi:MAG TPA: UDP-N-acetylglucosamine--N-acetylmuramyl-(pentapeptide) pyrophosphoryl-undecaprenol N-acetylglucosamine transferase [Acidimicrobiia bacterium]|nr:UDP-N-acetylglucosamine--N-acetylmuramyl-(pentapeptide) pyrophosphoryl-undecaprenol N-acetylglucosamine transferase [Acidimicrobiia bacterium]
MTFAIAAAGTGGHVFPGLAVGEALLSRGVAKESILFIGGDRIEAEIYPGAGFPFLRIEIYGLQRSMTTRNLTLPRVMLRARDTIASSMEERAVRVILGMGGYVTFPAALAARGAGVVLFVAEQNAGAGLANRVASRWASRVFTSFPHTEGLDRGEWVGNPVRPALVSFDRGRLRPGALSHFGLDATSPVLGVIGGSLGARVLNEAIASLVRGWSGRHMQVLHLTGSPIAGEGMDTSPEISWVQRPFEERIELFYAASDLVVARAGGGVAELTATGTPSILVPGDFGSSGHQAANAAFLGDNGAATVLSQDRIAELPGLVEELLFSAGQLQEMRANALGIAKPGAAGTIADAMLERS